ncbi:hypothetical protein [Humidesulfovibrio sp.]
MRTVALNLILAAAESCGLPPAKVVERSEDMAAEDVFLGRPRLELGWQPAEFTRLRQRLARVRSGSATHGRVRWAVYAVTLPVRCEVLAEDEAWIEEFCRRFPLTLPGQTADPDGNAVRITARRAERGGYSYGSVQLERKLSNALYVDFSGFACEDRDTPWIRSVRFNPKYEVHHGQED